MWFTNVVHLYLEPIFAHINATDIDCWPFRQSGSRLAIISFIWPSDEWSAPVLFSTSPSPYVANNLAIIKRWTAAFYGGRYENSRFLPGQVTQRNSFGNHLAHLFFWIKVIIKHLTTYTENCIYLNRVLVAQQSALHASRRLNSWGGLIFPLFNSFQNFSNQSRSTA